MPVLDPSSENSPLAAAPDAGELFALLTEHARDFIRVHDLGGRSIFASRSVERLYGQSPSTMFQFAHPEDLEACQRWWQEVLGGAAPRFRWRARDGSGRWRWLETSASVVRFHEQPHVLTVCRDISDQLQIESGLRDNER